jgi:hypothetical protein
MGLGAGLITGLDTDEVVSIRPGDGAYVEHTGAVYHPQDENDTGNVAFYEIQNQGDTIDFDLRRYTRPFDDPKLMLHTAFGPTDYTVEDRVTGNIVVDEQSGFDTDVWILDITSTSSELRITDFDPGGQVDGTQAAWYPYVSLFEGVV